MRRYQSLGDVALAQKIQKDARALAGLIAESAERGMSNGVDIRAIRDTTDYYDYQYEDGSRDARRRFRCDIRISKSM